jgi:hypothetical protein
MTRLTLVHWYILQVSLLVHLASCAHFMIDADQFQVTSNQFRSSGRSGNAPHPQQGSAQRAQVVGMTYSIQQYSDGTIHTQTTRAYSSDSFPGGIPMGALPDFPGYQPYATPESSRSRPPQSRHADFIRPRPRTPSRREPEPSSSRYYLPRDAYTARQRSRTPPRRAPKPSTFQPQREYTTQRRPQTPFRSELEPSTKLRWTEEVLAEMERTLTTPSSHPQITAGSHTRAAPPRNAPCSQTQSKPDLHLPISETFIHKPSSQIPGAGRGGRRHRTRLPTYTPTDDYSTRLIRQRSPIPGRILDPVEDNEKNYDLYAPLSPSRDTPSAPNANNEDPEVVDSSNEECRFVTAQLVHALADIDTVTQFDCGCVTDGVVFLKDDSCNNAKCQQDHDHTIRSDNDQILEHSPSHGDSPPSIAALKIVMDDVKEMIDRNGRLGRKAQLWVNDSTSPAPPKGTLINCMTRDGQLLAPSVLGNWLADDNNMGVNEPAPKQNAFQRQMEQAADAPKRNVFRERMAAKAADAPKRDTSQKQRAKAAGRTKPQEEYGGGRGGYTG